MMQEMNDAFELLLPDDPAPFEIVNPESTVPLLLICDHASTRIPEKLSRLGLETEVLQSHLAADLGAAELTLAVAERIGATAVLCNYSRLVIDCNRHVDDKDAFLNFGDNTPIPGNASLTASEKRARIQSVFEPYHQAIEDQIKRLSMSGAVPAFLSIHSFSPVLNGEVRDLEAGILWDKDRLTAELFLDAFRKAGIAVGDNEPYSGKAPQDYSVDTHAELKGLRHVAVEVRQDFLRNQAGVRKFSDLFCDCINVLIKPGFSKAAAQA